MLNADPQLTASEVLRVFHHDELNLFLGAAFATVGLVAAGFCAVRRKADALLLWFALFAVLYGCRMWLQSSFLAMIVPKSEFFQNLRFISNFLVAIPAAFFFNAAGFLGKYAKRVTYALAGVMACLVAGSLVFGRWQGFQWINNVVIIVLMIVMVVWAVRRHAPDRDFVIVRRGLLAFVAFGLWNNLQGLLRFHTSVEPYGFAVLLASLGYVAARRAIKREQDLSEIQKELDVARRIQLSILPSGFPELPSFRVVARYVPMTAVAGDFYEFLVADETQAGLLIADVSGHGVPSALIASMVKLAASSQKEYLREPARLLKGMNSALCGNTQSQFVTAAYVHLDARAKEMRYSAAAHLPMLLLRGGDVTAVEENGLMLAAFDFADYSTAVYPLMPGDRLVLYTDGIVEAEDEKQEQYGHERLSLLLRQTAGMTPGEAADSILKSVQQWAPQQNDDRTLLICDYVGSA
ncbi:MAG TPA: PP2C family protein-serine/threonine phosphatase [Edaphobacter sp.]